MALFSDIDWIILLSVGAFLLFGRNNAAVLRTLGRWYGRALRLKEELWSEVARAAELPAPLGPSGSVRASLLGLDAGPAGGRGIPAAVARIPPAPPASPPPPPGWPWTGGSPVSTWATTADGAFVPQEAVR